MRDALYLSSFSSRSNLKAETEDQKHSRRIVQTILTKEERISGDRVAHEENETPLEEERSPATCNVQTNDCGDKQRHHNARQTHNRIPEDANEGR